MATVEGPRYKGVDLGNPIIEDYIKNMIKNGDRNKRICEVIGVPMEIVEKVRIRVEGRSNND